MNFSKWKKVKEVSAMNKVMISLTWFVFLMTVFTTPSVADDSAFLFVSEGPNEDVIDRPLSNFSVSNAKVSEVINLLRTSYYIEVSFIEAVDDQRVTIIENGTVRDVIEQVITQSPEYRWEIVNGRLIVYPDRPEYAIIISNVDITGVPRLDAARLYIEQLKSETEAFEKLSGSGMKGDPRSSVYSTIVSLSTQSSVISHFVEILGTDPSIVFSIQSTQSGYFMFFLEKIKTPPQKDLETDVLITETACHPLSITYENQQDIGCGITLCGAKIQFDLTDVITCDGDDCQGKSVTESVTTDAGCLPGGVTTGPGCPIGAGNTISGCTDTYSLCSSASSYSAGGCVERYTQTLYVAGDDVEECTITFTITKNNTTCSGTVTRSCAQLNNINDYIAELSASLLADSPVSSGDTFDVEMVVHNTGDAVAGNTAPSSLSVNTLSGNASASCGGHFPFSADIASWSYQGFDWSCTASGEGTLKVSASASGTDMCSGGSVTADPEPAISNVVEVPEFPFGFLITIAMSSLVYLSMRYRMKKW